MNPNNKQSFNILTSIVFVAFGILVILTTIIKINEDDVLWHLATGRWIVQHQEIPENDVFGTVTGGQTWVPLEWGWDVLIYILYSISGNYTLLQIFTAIIWLSVCWMQILLMRRMQLPLYIILLVLCIVTLISLNRLTPRPQIITLLGLQLIIYLYLNFRYFTPQNPTRLYAIPFIVIFWANMHPGVLTGIALLFIFAVTEAFLFLASRDKWLKSRGNMLQPLEKKTIQRIILILFISVGVLIINPQGINTYKYIFSHIQLHTLMFIEEWVPPFQSQFVSLILDCYKIMVFVAAISIFYFHRTKDPIPAILYIIFLFYSLRAVRFIADFAVVTSIGTALGLSALAENKFAILHRIFQKNTTLIIMILLLATAIMLVPSNLLYDTLKYYADFGFGLDSNKFPISMFSFIKENRISGRPFNQFEYGGLLIWMIPNEKNFIDSRNLNDSIGKEYYSILLQQPESVNKLSQYGIDYIILRMPHFSASPDLMKKTLIHYCSTHRDDWKLIYWDDNALLYVKNIPKFKELIDKYTYHVIDPYLFGFLTRDFDSTRRKMDDAFTNEFARKMFEEPTGIIFEALREYLQNTK